MLNPDDLAQHRAKLLRKKETYTEKQLWKMLRNRRYRNLKFKRQFPITPYIADFYCHDLALVIELDGITHEKPDKMNYDKRRDAFMRRKGLTIIRITDLEFCEQPETLFAQIDKLVENMRR